MVGLDNNYLRFKVPAGKELENVDGEQVKKCDLASKCFRGTTAVKSCGEEVQKGWIIYCSSQLYAMCKAKELPPVVNLTPDGQKYAGTIKTN